MIVCVCNAISERDIDEAVDNGVTSMEALRHTLRVSTQCGSCSGCAEACLDRALSSRPQVSCNSLLPLAASQSDPIPA